MVYVDTSVLVGYYCPEPISEKVERFLMAQKRPAISLLTEVELFSALSKKIRGKEMNRRDASKVSARFLTHLDNDYYTNIPVETHHYRLARDWIGLFNTDLKSLDALHLAISSAENLTLVTVDKSLFKSARALTRDAILLE
ncbi:MAG: type II toxin-antitoxin system VapC family toxin [Deltaproteobacteria bacterium]|nr:type II toxin-antitoxin system VapC family toxin [Deltaproteobacteria bacterium]